jgi:hypothetical protein
MVAYRDTLQADFNGLKTDMRFSYTDPSEGRQKLLAAARIVHKYVEAIKSLKPPAEAKEGHRAVVQFMDKFAAFFNAYVVYMTQDNQSALDGMDEAEMNKLQEKMDTFLASIGVTWNLDDTGN